MDTTLKIDREKNSDLISVVLPGQKLATSKTPRMLTPAEIALLQEDLKAAQAYGSRLPVQSVNGR